MLASEYCKEEAISTVPCAFALFTPLRKEGGGGGGWYCKVSSRGNTHTLYISLLNQIERGLEGKDGKEGEMIAWR